MATTAKLDKKAGDPQIEIIIGQAQQGRYTVRLWDQEGKNPVIIAEGVNWDNVADIHTIGSVDKLDKRIVTWDVIVSALSSGPGQFYSVTVTIRQKGEAVEGGVFQEAGKLEGTKAILGVCTLAVS
jgi:hypothetical protein